MSQDLPAGVELTPSEEATADAVVIPDPGKVVDATVVPPECDDPAVCSYTVHMVGPDSNVSGGARAASLHPNAIGLNGARIASVRTKRKRALRKLHVRRRQGQGEYAARAAVAARSWSVTDDHICSIGGCFFWEVQLNSKAYCDGSWAWGSRSRYGYAGYATKSGTHAAGYSISTDFLGFFGDPSHSDLFASHDATVSVLYKGAPASVTRYVHRHFPGNCGTSWGVVG